MEKAPERPVAVGPIQDAEYGPRVVLAFANGTIVAFSPSQARELGNHIINAASQAEAGKHATGLDLLLQLVNSPTEAPDAPRH